MLLFYLFIWFAVFSCLLGLICGGLCCVCLFVVVLYKTWWCVCVCFLFVVLVIACIVCGSFRLVCVFLFGSMCAGSRVCVCV